MHRRPLAVIHWSNHPFTVPDIWWIGFIIFFCTWCIFGEYFVTLCFLQIVQKCSNKKKHYIISLAGCPNTQTKALWFGVSLRSKFLSSWYFLRLIASLFWSVVFDCSFGFDCFSEIWIFHWTIKNRISKKENTNQQNRRWWVTTSKTPSTALHAVVPAAKVISVT